MEIRDVSQVNWKKWRPQERAVLCFIEDASNVLLIHKKTGLGKGKVNAPGGRIKAGETPYEAAVRETNEEVALVPQNLVEVGQLFFIFTDGYSLHGTVFWSKQYSGTPVETREADPFWCALNAIPYDQMWADDRVWLPRVLNGEYIRGYFIFEDDTMLSQKLEIGKYS